VLVQNAIGEFLRVGQRLSGVGVGGLRMVLFSTRNSILLIVSIGISSNPVRSIKETGFSRTGIDQVFENSF